MSSREAFEEWAKKEGYRVFSDARGSYDMPSTNCVWAAWQAATERAAYLVPPYISMLASFRHGLPEGQDKMDWRHECPSRKNNY